MKKKIAVIGLGYVGLPLALEFGKNYSVIGFDSNSTRIQQLRDGFDRTLECSEEQIFESHSLSFTDDSKELKTAEIYIVTVPTPVDSGNSPDLQPLRQATSTIAKYLHSGDIVIFESTVYPGATEEVCVPILESISGLEFNTDFYCGYSPERVNPGDKVNKLTTIKKVVSGSEENTAKEIKQLYDSIMEVETWLAPSIKVAEAAKVIENSQRDLNIAFVNELSIIFDRLGIDTKDVLEAAATKWNFLDFKPGIVGGHCIGVDPYYLTYKAEQIGYHSQVILSGRRMNDNMAKYAAKNILKRMAVREVLTSGAIVTILGATFKEDCPDIRNSKVFDMVNEFEAWGLSVQISDPYANSNEVFLEYGKKMTPFDQLSRCDALVVAVSHNQYKTLSTNQICGLCKVPMSTVIGDLKSIYDKDLLANAGFDVFRF